MDDEQINRAAAQIRAGDAQRRAAVDDAKGSEGLTAEAPVVLPPVGRGASVLLPIDLYESARAALADHARALELIEAWRGQFKDLCAALFPVASAGMVIGWKHCIASAADLRARLAKAEAGQAAAEERASKAEKRAGALAADLSAVQRGATEAVVLFERERARAKALEAALRHPTAYASRWMCEPCDRWLYDGDGDLVQDAGEPCSNCDPLRALLAAPAADPEVSRG